MQPASRICYTLTKRESSNRKLQPSPCCCLTCNTPQYVPLLSCAPPRREMHKRNWQPQPQPLPTEPSANVYPGGKDTGKRVCPDLWEASSGSQSSSPSWAPASGSRPTCSVNTRLDLHLFLLALSRHPWASAVELHSPPSARGSGSRHSPWPKGEPVPGGQCSEHSPLFRWTSTGCHRSHSC